MEEKINVGWRCIKEFTPINGAHSFTEGFDMELKKFKVGDIIPSWLYAHLPRDERKNFIANEVLKSDIYGARRYTET